MLRQRLSLPEDASNVEIQQKWRRLHRRLGLAEGAPIDEIRSAFRRRALELHPDKHKSNPEAAGERFRLLKEARELLSDVDLRAEVQAALTVRPPPQVRGEDLEHAVRLDLGLALRGGLWATDIDLGVHGWRRIHVTLPQGTEPGLLVRVPGEGGQGDPPGDLWLVVEALTHPTLRVDGIDVVGTLAVTYAAVYEGRNIVVETPWDLVQLRLKPGTFGRVRIPGHGVRRGRQLGAMVLTLDVIWPAPGDLELAAVLRRLQPDAGSRTALRGTGR